MSITKVGILIDSCFPTQHSVSLVNNFNQVVDEVYDICPIAFYREVARSIIQPKFALMQQVHAWAYDGIIISTNLVNTMVLTNCNRAKRKLFYVYDLEWLYLQQTQYDLLTKLYLNPDIDLIARSESHYDILKKYWKSPIGVLHDYDKKEIISLIRSIR